MPLVVMHPQGGTAWAPAGPLAGNPGPPAAAAPNELANLLSQLGRFAGPAGRQPGGAAAAPSAARATSAFADYQGPSASSNGLSTQLEAVAFWAQLHEISRGGLQNAIEAVQTAHPQLASLIVPPEPSPAAATALQLLQAAQSSRTLPPMAPPQAQQPTSGSALPHHHHQVQQPSCGSDASAVTAAARLMASLSALHQQQQQPQQPHPAPAPPPPAPAPQQHTIRVVAAPAPHRPHPGAATVVHVQQVAPPPLLTAVGMYGGRPKGSSPTAGAFAAVPNGASGFGSRDWSLDGGSASDGSQEQARKRARLDHPAPAANGGTGYAPPPPPSSNGKVCSNCHTSSTPFWRKDRHTGLPLCNACGLYAAKNDHPRPVKLWREGQAPGQPQHRLQQQPQQPQPPPPQQPPQQQQHRANQEREEQQEQATAASAVEALHQLQSLQKDSPTSSPTQLQLQQQQQQRSRSSSPPEQLAAPTQHGTMNTEQLLSGGSPPPTIQQPAPQPQVPAQPEVQVQVVRSMPPPPAGGGADSASPASQATSAQPQPQTAAQPAQRQHDSIPPDMLAQAAAALLATAISATRGPALLGKSTEASLG